MTVIHCCEPTLSIEDIATRSVHNHNHVVIGLNKSKNALNFQINKKQVMLRCNFYTFSLNSQKLLN